MGLRNSMLLEFGGQSLGFKVYLDPEQPTFLRTYIREL